VIPCSDTHGVVLAAPLMILLLIMCSYILILLLIMCSCINAPTPLCFKCRSVRLQL